MSDTEPEYHLEKSVWTTDDFDQMGWHDAWIHAMSFDTATHKFLLDIDYIYEWVEPAPDTEFFSFWVSPCTLVFDDVYGVDLNLQTSNEVSIQDITRVAATHVDTSELVEGAWNWTIECNEGTMAFTSTGFTQYTRRVPQHIDGQAFDLSDRGGARFDLLTTPEAM